ncbi:hypothetical protein SALWKB12_1541 [Snodgrassella communis]|nr:hypothetical protein SALWKB12_1541 [Snodgrassella communis]
MQKQSSPCSLSKSVPTGTENAHCKENASGITKNQTESLPE